MADKKINPTYLGITRIPVNNNSKVNIANRINKELNTEIYYEPIIYSNGQEEQKIYNKYKLTQKELIFFRGYLTGLLNAYSYGFVFE